jgi:hypothetical protein
MFTQLLSILAVVTGLVLLFCVWVIFSKDRVSEKVWKKYGPFLLRSLKAKKLLRRQSTIFSKIQLEILRTEAMEKTLGEKNQEMRKINRLVKLKLDQWRQLSSVINQGTLDGNSETFLAMIEIKAEIDELYQEFDELSAKVEEEVVKINRSVNNLKKREKSANKRSDFVLALFARAGLA